MRIVSLLASATEMITLERTMQDIPLLQIHSEWRSLRAVQQGRVYAIDGNYYLNRSGHAWSIPQNS